MHKQQGFTLIEIIVVILILGILAATALPKFINVSSDDRTASVNGLVGGLKTAVALAQEKYAAAGSTSTTTVTLQDGSTSSVNANTGIPDGTSAGIGAMMQDLSDYTVDYTTATAVTFRPTGGSSTCQATYNGTTGVVGNTTSGC